VSAAHQASKTDYRLAEKLGGSRSVLLPLRLCVKQGKLTQSRQGAKLKPMGLDPPYVLLRRLTKRHCVVTV